MAELTNSQSNRKPSNPDETSVKKRRVGDLLPAVLQTDVLKKFFNSAIDPLYQPQSTEELVGYIGAIPNYYDPERDFYIAEPTKAREIYQLTPTMVSRDLISNDFQRQLFYEDLINSLRFKGALTNNHQRLFSQEYYSWCPPIDLDKFMNFRDYYWIPIGPEPIVINDPTDLAAFVGQTTGTLLANGEPLELSSGLKIRPTNDPSPEYNDKILITEGVGRSILFVEDTALATGWDLQPWDTTLWDEIGEVTIAPDYITMERGAFDNNQWSRTNRWFHRNVIQNFFNPALIRIQATRPIIEFERNLELWNVGTIDRGLVDLVITNCPTFYSLLQEREPGMPVIPPANPGDLPTIGCGIEVDEVGGTWPLSDLGYTQLFVEDGTGNKIQIRDGLRILLPIDNNPGVRNKIVAVTGVALGEKITLQVLNNGVNPFGEPVFSEKVELKNTNGRRVQYWFNGADWVEGQTKLSTNQAPLFQLYDVDRYALNDPATYPQSSFTNSGNKVFSYAVDTDPSTPIDPVLGFRVIRNEFNEIVFENDLVNNRYTYVEPGTNIRKPIIGYYFFKINNQDVSQVIYNNGWWLVPEPSVQAYSQRFENKIGEDTFNLSIIPSIPLEDRNSTQRESLVVRINGVKQILNTDFTYNSATNQIILTDPLEEDQILEIATISDDSPIVDDGAYVVPLNLQANADNRDIRTVGFNQLFDHFYSNIGAQTGLVGNLYNRNNYRDTAKTKYFGNNILQHTAPLLRTMALASSPEIDIINSIKYVEREYIRFKNKFIQKITQFREQNTLPELDPSDWVDLALVQINVGKNNEFPFKNTGMGYKNTVNPDQTFIPPTPSFLGITRVFQPEVYVDNTFETPVELIQNHDGSITPTFGDFRDDVILTLETRIYDSILPKFKGDRVPLLSRYDVIPGKFRTTEYTYKEIIQIVQPMFELWVAQTGLDPVQNNFNGGGGELTINYRSVPDYDGEPIPGGWRGIFFWFYDTDKPHLAPWDMLGFSVKPSWWDAEYGVAPYTSGNTPLWSDLEQGLIRQGDRAGIDTRFARPGLQNIIPVDAIGNLKTPLEIGIIKQLPSETNAGAPWELGDIGPIEAAWIKSEYFSFDLCQLLYLTKPAKFIEYNWDSADTEFVYNEEIDLSDPQFIHRSYKLRPRNNQQVVHDETRLIANEFAPNIDFSINNNLVRRWGIQQFVSNFLESQGKSITNSFGSIIRGLRAQLGHKAAGFIDAQTLRLDSDSFGRVPTENVYTLFYRSNSIREVFYGGVIVERSDKGYKVYGYDLLNPVFYTIPGDPNGLKARVGIGSKGSPFEVWRPNTRYFVGDIVLYELNNQFYRCIREHVSSSSLDAENWVSINRPTIQYQLSVTKLQQAKQGAPIQTVRYGTEFTTVQQVFDFLIDYERFLVSEGFVFDKYDAEANDTVDWTWSGKEFMSWVLSVPGRGEIIALSPAATQLKFRTEFGRIEPVEQIVQGVYSLLNRDGIQINPRDTVVSRFDGELEIIPYNLESVNTYLYSARFFLTEVEHIIIIDNATIFNDIIYDPLFNIAQQRLRMSAVRARGWQGRFDAPGFIVTENQLLPNYDKLVDQIRYIFDIDKSSLVQKQWREYGYHNIGYQERDYLNQLIISEKSQLNFYQGMIRQKGTASSFNKLLRSEFITRTSDLFFFEEWGFRVGTYGNYDNRPSLEIKFPQDDYKQNPQRIEFPLIPIPPIVQTGPTLPSNPADHSEFFFNTITKQLYQFNPSTGQYKEIFSWTPVFESAGLHNPLNDVIEVFTVEDGGMILGDDGRWLRRPDTTVDNIQGWIFNDRKSEFGNLRDLPNAGYVQVNEGTYYAFNAQALFALYDELKENGTKLKDGDTIWVYDTNQLLGSKFNQPLKNAYQNWSIFRVSKYNRNVVSTELVQDNILNVGFTFAETFDYNDEGSYDLSVPVITENNILVIEDQPEVKTQVSADNFFLTGAVVSANTVAAGIASGQTIFFSYNDTILTGSLQISDQFTYDGVTTSYTLSYEASTDISVSYSSVTPVSATYKTSATSAAFLNLGTAPTSGHTIWVTYTPILEFVESPRTYTEFFISDGTTTNYTLAFEPILSSIVVITGSATFVSANNYDVELNPFVQVSSSNADTVWAQYDFVSAGPAFTEQFVVTSSVQQFRLINKPRYDSVVVYQGSARTTFVKQPGVDFAISGGNTLEILTSASEQSSIRVQYLVTDPSTDNIPVNSFIGDGVTNEFSLSNTPATDRNILVFKDGLVQMNTIDYNVSGNSVDFADTPNPGSNIWVQFVSDDEQLSPTQQFIVSAQQEFDLGMSAATFSIVADLNDVFLEPSVDFIVSATKFKLSEIPPLEQILTIRFINPVPALRTHDIIIFDNIQGENEMLYEGIYEIQDVTQQGQITIELEEIDFPIVTSQALEDIRQPENIFVLQELRFSNVQEYLDLITTTRYGSIFSGPNAGGLIYVDDARTESEKTLIEPYFSVASLPSNSWASIDSMAVFKDNVIRKQQPKIDTSLFFNAVIYDKDRDDTITQLEVYDPYKGIIPGVADKEIWYKLDFDPAKYNQGDPDLHQIDDEQAWGQAQVGRVWWDLKTVRYLEYEMGPNSYRREFWGRLAPGSSIDVYEWVRSTVPPEEYQSQANDAENVVANTIDNTPTGEIFSPENPAYTTIEEFNSELNNTQTIYYFWVKNKITLPNVGFRKTTVLSVANILKDPIGSGVLWFSPISESALVVANTFSLLADDATVLQVNWSISPDAGNWHKQWVMAREFDPSYFIDPIIFNKMVDSLVGYDLTGLPVPDPILNDVERYGNFIRPRQTWFVDKTKARFNLIEFLNYLFRRINFTARLNGIAGITLEDQPPFSADFTVADYTQRDFLAVTNTIALNETVLVQPNLESNNFWTIWRLVDDVANTFELVVAQTYKTSDFFTSADYYADEQNPLDPPTKIYDTETDRDIALANELILIGDIVRINDVAGSWEWQIYTGDEFIVVAKEGATVEFSDNFFNNTIVYGINEEWETFSEESLLEKILTRDGSLEIRELLNAFRFNDALENIETNRIFFNMVRYAFSENQVIDWAFKTSYILFGGTIEALGQESIVRPSIFDSLIGYITEMKPYHVKFREFARRIATALDVYETNITDFDSIEDANDNPDLVRKIKIKQKFDRVTCEASDDEPVAIRILADGQNNIFNMVVNGTTIVTLPFVLPYSPFKVTGRQYWSTENIESVQIKNPAGILTILEPSEWRIEETTVIDGSFVIPAFRIVLRNTIPVAGSLIEIIRRIGAAGRIDRYYESITTLWNGQPVSNIVPEPGSPGLISGCDFKGTIVEGGPFELPAIASAPSDFYDVFASGGYGVSGQPWPLHDGPLDTIIEGNKFIQPYLGPNRPEELSVIRVSDPLVLDVYHQEFPGAPIAYSFRATGEVLTGRSFDLPGLPQSVEAIFLFINGEIQTQNVDYTVDWANQEITYIGTGWAGQGNQIELNVYSTGGDKIHFTAYFKVDQATTGNYGYTINVDRELRPFVSAQNIFATIDGILVSAYNTVGGEIFVDTSGLALAGDETVIINIFQSTNIAEVRTEYLTLSAGQTVINPTYQSGPVIPISQSTLVFGDGKRLIGPRIKYYVSDGVIEFFDADEDLTVYSANVYVDGVDTPWTLLSSQPTVIELNPVPASGAQVIIEILNGQYTIDSSAGTVTFVSAFSSDVDLTVVTFNNNTSMGIRTERFEGSDLSEYKLSQMPYSPLNVWAAISGENTTFSVDYIFADGNIGYDEGLFGAYEFGTGADAGVIKFDESHSAKSVYITYMTGVEKKDAMAFRGFKPLIGDPEYTRISNSHKLILKENITVDTSAFEVYDNFAYVPSLIDDTPLITPNPQGNIPGVVWVDGERIEYWNLSSPQIVSGKRYWRLGNIARGTKQTSKGVTQTIEFFKYAGDGSTVSFPVSASVPINDFNTSVIILTYTPGPGPWDDLEAEEWDDFAWDFTPVEQTEQVLNNPTDYTIVSGNIVFNTPVSLDPLSTSANPLFNILVRVTVDDWTSSNIVHREGEHIINANPSQNMPGGYDPLYNRVVGNRMGMQWKEHMQGEFLGNKPGNLNNP